MDKQIELYQTLLAKKRIKGLDDLFFFNKFVLETNKKRRELLVPHVHGEWTEWYQNSKKRIKMILVPRACFKSTFFTVGRTIQALAQNRNSRILIANATLPNAQKFASEVKEHLMKNEQLISIYGKFYDKGLRWNEDEFDVLGKDLGSREPSVTAAGVGGNLVSQHYSHIIADDLMNLENSSTKYQVDKVIDWWKRAFSLLDYDGEMIIIGTRWSYYDLYSYIEDNFEDLADIYIRGAYNEDGSLYFPELLNEEKLKELRDLQGSYVFSSFYLNNPVDAESALIKRDMIKYWGDREHPADMIKPENLPCFVVVDPAVSQSEDADESSMMAVEIDSENNWYVVETRSGKWTVGELIQNLFSIYEQRRPITMSIEVIGQGQMLMESIYQEEDRRNKYLPLVEIKVRPQIKKEMRIRSALQPRFERGKIFIRKDMVELEEQLLKFPKSRRDDMIDSLTDVEEIGFPAESREEKAKESSSFFQNQLEKQFKGETYHIDPFMGEFF